MLPIHCAKKPYEKLADGTVKKVEVPYEIPDSWEWVRLKTIYQVINGDRGKNYPSKDKLFENGEIPFINAGNIANEVISSQNLLYLSEEQYNKLGNGKLIKGDVIFCLRGSLGKFGIFNMEKGAIASSLVIIRPYYNNSKDIDIYFSKYLASPVLLSEIRKYNNGTAQPNLSAKALNNFFIPLPPLAEQKRIVAQIERALEKVEAYAESYNKLQELDRAFPDKLKKSILQYAMQGKLVAQDPNDEPVEVLLEKIRAEKQKLYEEGKLKKKDLAEIVVEKGDDNSPYQDVPYDIPESWNWVKLRNIGSITSGGTPKSSEPSYYGGNITWITPADMGKQQNNKFFAKSSKKITELGLQKSSAQLISKNSIVYSSRAPIGHINIVTEDYTTNQGCKSITPLLVDLIFLYWLLQFRTKDIILRSSGTTFKEISASGFGDTLLPLPPLAEQKRIVAQIEQVISLIETLV